MSSLTGNQFCKARLFKYLLAVVFVLTSFLLCFYKLAEPELVRWDEYTNYRVVVDTIDNQDFWSLRYKQSSTGYFFEKPPLWYWLTIGSVRVLGQNRFAVRFVSAVSGFAFILSIFVVAKRIFKSYWAGFFSGLAVLGTKHLFWVNHVNVFSTHTLRSADLDSLQLLFFVISFWSLWEFENSFHKKSKFLIFSSIASGLGFLTKGPFSCLPYFIYFLYRLIHVFVVKSKLRNPLRILFYHSFIFVVVFAFLVFPWHVFMYLKFGPNFFEEYFYYHIVARAFSSIEGHTGFAFMFWKYLFYPNLFVSGFLLFAGIGVLIWKYKAQVLKRFDLFSAIFGVFCTLVLLTVIKTQIAWYIFYVYPSAFLVIGKFAQELIFLKNKFWKYTSLGILLLWLCVQVFGNFFYFLKLKFL
jgi:4-amino-4-deoxy-L-arabinose transferase-like glycosyltransferase